MLSEFRIGDVWDNVSRIETALPIGRLRKLLLFATSAPLFHFLIGFTIEQRMKIAVIPQPKIAVIPQRSQRVPLRSERIPLRCQRIPLRSQRIPPSVTEPANPLSVRSDPASASGYKSLMNVRIRSRCQSNECGWFMIEESRLLVESPTRSVFALKLKNWHAEYPAGNYNAAGTLQYVGETTPYVVCSKEKPGFVAIDQKGGWGFSEVAPGAHRRSSGYTESALALYWAACHGLNVQDVYETASLATKLGYPATAGDSSEVTQISSPTDAILIP